MYPPPATWLLLAVQTLLVRWNGRRDRVEPLLGGVEVSGGFDAFAFEEEVREVLVLFTLLHGFGIVNR